MRIAYARESAPSARKLQEVDDSIELYESSSVPVDINWGRRYANSDLNPDIENTVNKRRMRELFREHGVDTPRLYEPWEALHLPLNEIGELVGRPDYHTRKRGYWHCTTMAEIERAIIGGPRKQAATHFIEYISKERAPREYRVHIFNGRSIRLSEKQPDDNDRGFTTVPPTHNVSHVREAAKHAVAAVGLDFGAVDVLASDSECWVLEVNAAPGLGGTMPETYVRAFKQWKGESDE